MGSDIMIDIETLGTSFEAPVLSMGAVKFDKSKNKIVDEFYRKITLESAMHYGKAEADTVRWWLEKPDDIRLELTSTKKDGAVHLPEALRDLADWFPNSTGGVWANGPSFDLVILETMFKRAKVNCPWKFWDHRCCRTVWNVGQDIGVTIMSQSKGAHNALEDAKYQAKWVMKVLSAIRDEFDNRGLRRD